MNRLATLLVLLPGAALAHPGHPDAAAGPAHWLTHADHLLVLALAVAAGGLGAWRLRRSLAASATSRRARP